MIASIILLWLFTSFVLTFIFIMFNEITTSYLFRSFIAERKHKKEMKRRKKFKDFDNCREISLKDIEKEEKKG